MNWRVGGLTFCTVFVLLGVHKQPSYAHLFKGNEAGRCTFQIHQICNKYMMKGISIMWNHNCSWMHWFRELRLLLQIFSAHPLCFLHDGGPKCPSVSHIWSILNLYWTEIRDHVFFFPSFTSIFIVCLLFTWFWFIYVFFFKWKNKFMDIVWQRDIIHFD